MMISVGLILSLLVHNNFCHVALTFPPARNLNLDFLDNVRCVHSLLCVDDWSQDFYDFQDYCPMWNAKGGKSCQS